ncbi:hypothetical protein BCR43DRAFT_493793 [Syncephalastrum racemosum]|uniref:F-box domain-containing protein n=1 Tax=Syncephalastrum racemosum TaxID=13706 RepID=A0A1X2HB59_SYNRA|nr:hypothetical protein BCR43DRAFT_493793 [Syncephalastrum racemosum]
MTTSDTFPASLEEALYKALKAAIHEDNMVVASSLRDLLRQVLESKIRQLLQACDYRTASQCAGWLLETHRAIASPLLYYGEIAARAGRAEEATRIYELGALLFPAKCGFRDRIIQLERSNDKRRDPILCLPTELITCIFEYVPEQRMVSRRVSHAWRDMLDQLPVWRNVKICRDKSDYLTQLIPSIPMTTVKQFLPQHVPVLSRQIQHLAWSTYYPSDYVMQTLATNECTQLGSLHLIMKNGPLRGAFSEFGCSFSQRPITPFLTDLTLDVHHGQRYSILRLLASLPQLVSFQYRQRSCSNSADEEILFSGPSFPSDPLTLRHLCCLGVSWSSDELAQLPPLLPGLESLVVEQHSDIEAQDMLLAFMQRCRKLQTVVWADDVDSLLDVRAAACDGLNFVLGNKNTKAGEPRPSSGISHLLLGESLRITADMQDFFSRNQHTLQVLHFGNRESGALGLQHPVFQQMCFSQLRCLSLYATWFPLAHSLPHILSLCPKLEELGLLFIDLFLDDDPQAIAGLSRLQTLTIENCYYDSDFLPQLFQEIIASGCPLANLTIIDDLAEDSLVTELMLAHLGDMFTLRKLVLDATFDTVSDDHIDTFLIHARISGLAENLQYLDICRSTVEGRPLWIVLLHSVFVEAHIIPGFGSSKGIVF